jgi:hypothetical protein
MAAVAQIWTYPPASISFHERGAKVITAPTVINVSTGVAAGR